MPQPQGRRVWTGGEGYRGLVLFVPDGGPSLDDGGARWQVGGPEYPDRA